MNRDYRIDLWLAGIATLLCPMEKEAKVETLSKAIINALEEQNCDLERLEPTGLDPFDKALDKAYLTVSISLMLKRAKDQKYEIKTDKITNGIGLLGAVLIVQQTYFPELIPEEYIAPIVASLVGTFGIATNKESINIPFTEDTKKRKKICELEAEIEQLKRELREIEELTMGSHANVGYPEVLDKEEIDK